MLCLQIFIVRVDIFNVKICDIECLPSDLQHSVGSTLDGSWSIPTVAVTTVVAVATVVDASVGTRFCWLLLCN